jgi:hypothetical protein
MVMPPLTQRIRRAAGHTLHEASERFPSAGLYRVQSLLLFFRGNLPCSTPRRSLDVTATLTHPTQICFLCPPLKI